MNSASDRALPSVAAIADVSGATDVEVGDGGEVLVADSDPGCGTARVRLFSPAGVASSVVGGCTSPLPHSPRLAMEGDHFVLGFVGRLERGSVAAPVPVPVPLPRALADTQLFFSVETDAAVTLATPVSVVRVPSTGNSVTQVFGTDLLWPWSAASNSTPTGALAAQSGAVFVEAFKSLGTHLVAWSPPGSTAVAAIRGNQSVSIVGVAPGAQATLPGLRPGEWHARRKAVAWAGVVLALLEATATASPDAGVPSGDATPSEGGSPDGRPDGGLGATDAGPEADLGLRTAMEWLGEPSSGASADDEVSDRFVVVGDDWSRLVVRVVEADLCVLRRLKYGNCDQGQCEGETACELTEGCETIEASSRPRSSRYEVFVQATDSRRDFESTRCVVEAVAMDEDGVELATIQRETTVTGPTLDIQTPDRLEVPPGAEGNTRLLVEVQNRGRGAWRNRTLIEVATPSCAQGRLSFTREGSSRTGIEAGSSWGETYELALHDFMPPLRGCEFSVRVDPALGWPGARPDSPNFRIIERTIPVDYCHPIAPLQLRRTPTPWHWKLDVRPDPALADEPLVVEGEGLVSVNGHERDANGTFVVPATKTLDLHLERDVIDELSITVRSETQCSRTVSLTPMSLELSVSPPELERRDGSREWKPQMLELSIWNGSSRSFRPTEQPYVAPSSVLRVLGSSPLSEIAPGATGVLRVPAQFLADGVVSVSVTGAWGPDGDVLTLEARQKFKAGPEPEGCGDMVRVGDPDPEPGALHWMLLVLLFARRMLGRSRPPR